MYDIVQYKCVNYSKAVSGWESNEFFPRKSILKERKYRVKILG